MRGDLSPNYRPGDVLTADTIDQVIDGLNNPNFDVRGDGIDVRKGVHGQIQLRSVNSYAQGIFKGKVTSGGITARTSDSVHGTGNVEIWVKNPSTGHYVDSGVVQGVDYISSTTGGLPSGTWVNCGWQEDGTAEIISVDCGN